MEHPGGRYAIMGNDIQHWLNQKEAE